jgi:phage tail tape-measure protein
MDLPLGIVGASTGAAMGSPLGPPGMFVGGMIGGAIGTFSGQLLSDGLEEKDLIEKTQCEFDKRSTLLSLSDKGKALYPQIMPLVNQVYEKALSGFSENEKHSVMDLLNRAINNLDTPS